jgi:hypothetical protein
MGSALIVPDRIRARLAGPFASLRVINISGKRAARIVVCMAPIYRPGADNSS